MLRITLGKLLEEQTQRSPDAHFVTFVDTGERLSYAEFNERCNRFAHGLAERGVGAGDFVGIMLRNSLEYLVSSYALKKLGAVEVALNIDFRGPGLVRMVNLTQSPMLITSNEFLAPLNQVAGQLTHLNTLIVTDDVDTPLPGCEHVAFESVLSSNDENPGVKVRDTDLTIILFTSGTTGLSKGLLLSHRFVMCGATGVVETYGLTDQDCVYTPWPLHHYGAAVCE
ncbi:MAG: hypothetical protein CMO26_20035, partial [Thiotrichales bacterium]|nr:hypothetical protein [Thiotrichales bacterium]